MKRVVCDSSNGRIFTQPYITPFIANGKRVSSVPCLRSGCRPATVTRLIISIVINAVERSPRRTLAHVGKEVFEAVFPAVADGNSSRPVSGEIVMAGAQASLSHGSPRFVSRVRLNGVRLLPHHIEAGARTILAVAGLHLRPKRIAELTASSTGILDPRPLRRVIARAGTILPNAARDIRLRHLATIPARQTRYLRHKRRNGIFPRFSQEHIVIPRVA